MKVLHRAQALFVRMVDRIEGNPAPASRYFILFFAILAVRLALEFFSTQRLFTLDDVVHIGLWFAFIVLAFMLQLQLFSGVPMARVGKLVVVSFTIALTAPVIDLILRGGVGSKMNYLAINSWADVAFAYVTVGGASLSRGATLGIRIEILLLIFASFNYLRTKTGSIFRALLGTLCIYTVLFASGTVPKLLGLMVEHFLTENAMQATSDISTSIPSAYRPDDNSTVLFLLCLDLILLGCILWRHSSRWMQAILQAIPWGALLLAIANFGIGAGLAIKAYPDNWSLHPTTMFWFPLLLALALVLGAHAGLFKLPDSLAGHPSSSANAAIRPPRALIQGGLLVLTLGISLAISNRVFFATMVVWGLIFLLNEPPLMLKHIPLLRNLLEVMILVGAALLGFAVFGGPMIGFPGKWLMVLLGATAMGSLVTDVGRKGDSIILWYRDWLLPFQRLYRFAAWTLAFGAAILTVHTLGLSLPAALLLPGLVVLPLLIQTLISKDLPWLTLAFIPAWGYLVFSVWA